MHKHAFKKTWFLWCACWFCPLCTSSSCSVAHFHCLKQPYTMTLMPQSHQRQLLLVLTWVGQLHLVMRSLEKSWNAASFWSQLYKQNPTQGSGCVWKVKGLWRSSAVRRIQTPRWGHSRLGSRRRLGGWRNELLVSFLSVLLEITCQAAKVKRKWILIQCKCLT